MDYIINSVAIKIYDNNKFYLIDYSFMDVKEDYPYINIYIQDFNKYLYNEDYFNSAYLGY